MYESWKRLSSIDDISREEWNEVVISSGSSVFHTHEWLKSYEASPPAPLHGVHHLVYRNQSRAKVVAPLYDVSEDPHYTGYGPDYGFDHEILRTRMLVGHSWYSYFNGVCATIPADQYADDLVDQMDRIAREVEAPIYGFPGIPENSNFNSHLERLGFAPVYTEATSGVNFAGSHDGHLATLRTKKFRKEFRRLATMPEKLDAEVRYECSTHYIDQFATLVEDVCQRHGIPTINPPDNIRSIFREMPEYVHFITAWSKEETLLGGFILLHFEGTLYAWIAGLNYDCNKRFGTYYALYSNTLTLAEKLGVRRIEMGRSMYGFKTRMGFHPTPLVSWFKPTSAEAEAMLEDGIRTLESHCRTRERIVEAYARNSLPVPSHFEGPPMFAGRD